MLRNVWHVIKDVVNVLRIMCVGLVSLAIICSIIMGLLIIAVEDVKRHVCNVSSVIIIVRFVRLDLSLPVLGFAHSVLMDVWHAMDLWAATTVHQDILSYLPLITYPNVLHAPKTVYLVTSMPQL